MEKLDTNLLEKILNGSNQMIQVSDAETYEMLYANDAALKFAVSGAGKAQGEAPEYQGQPCHKYMMGLDSPCPFCPLRETDGDEPRESEVDNGNQVFAVKTQRIDWNGRKAFIEYAGDITRERRSQQVFEAQKRTLIQSLTHAQGLFHLDVTDDRCMSAGGISRNVQEFSEGQTIQDMISIASEFIPDPAEKADYLRTFCRSSMLAAFEMSQVQIDREYSLYYDDGSLRCTRISARLSLNPANEHLECILYGLDISAEKTQQIKHEQQLREQLAIFDVLSRDFTNVYLIDLHSDQMKLLKLEGFVIDGLDVTQDKLYPYYATCKQYIGERVHPDDVNKMLEALKPESIMREIEKHGECVSTYRILADGETHYFQYKYIPLGGTDNIIAGFQNIDALIADEKQQHDALEAALAEAERSNHAKTTFLNSISHDIRTPLNAIIGFTALASTHIDDPESVAGYLSKITTSSNHLLSLINDVLDMSHIESGKINIEEAPVHLSDLLNDLRMIILPNVSSKQLDLFIDTQNVTSENIITDKLRLNQVLLNILTNAIKFTKPGGNIRFRVVELHDAPEGQAHFKFQIRDTGIGISKEFQEHIFEAFTREQTSTISGIQGTGLGMSIAKSIVDMMGGNISVESEPGKGTEFTVDLTFRVCGGSSVNEIIPQLKGMRALIADDDFNTCASVTQMLDSIGMRSEWTTSGKEAVLRTKLALERHDEFSVFIIDWLMPDMNGIETVRRIRQIIGVTKPIIILTAYDWTEVESEAREAGVVAFCSKPIFMSELRNILSKPYHIHTADSDEKNDSEIFRNKKILLVEDNELNMEIAAELLKEAGFNLGTASDGTEAVEKIKNSAPGEYDLVLMDIQMPKMNGFEATQAIRQLPDKRLADIPIFAMTANAFEEDRQKALSAGMNGHIAKPLDIPKLFDTLRELFSK